MVVVLLVDILIMWLIIFFIFMLSYGNSLVLFFWLQKRDVAMQEEGRKQNYEYHFV
jgi:hypothetical protein